MRTRRHAPVAAIVMMAGMLCFQHTARAGDKIETSPISTSGKQSGSPLAPTPPRPAAIDFDKLGGPRIQSLQPGGPGIPAPMPAPQQRPAADKPDKNWLVDSVMGNKPLDYNRALGVRDPLAPRNRDSSDRGLNSPDGGADSSLRPRLSSGRSELLENDPRRSDPLGRPGFNSSTPDLVGRTRGPSAIEGLPGFSSNPGRDFDKPLGPSTRLPSDSLMGGLDRARPSSVLSIEQILRPPGSPATSPARPRIEAPATSRPLAMDETLRVPVPTRELAPAAAFQKQAAEAVSTAPRAKPSATARPKDDIRNRPAVLPIPKRGF